MLLHARAVQCSQAGQGFGDSSSKHARSVVTKGGKRRKEAAGVKSGDSKAVERAVKLVEQQDGSGQRHSGTRPVDPREAAHGKVEFVKVRDWGSGKPEELGSLHVEAGSKMVEVEVGGDPAQPFHETLARRLELLQMQGALGVAQLPGGKPLPEFQRWAFAWEHYQQYLVDMYAVHAALESSIAGAAAEVAASTAAAVAGQQQHLQQALGLFGAEQGLDRAEAVLQDLAAIQRQQQQQDGGSKDSSSSSVAAEASPLAPTQHAVAYAAYIVSLSRLCRAAEDAEELEQAVLRLLGHAYMLHLMHLTSGGRIAAAAAQKLDLAPTGAFAFHSSYPALDARLGGGAKPLEAFVTATNSLGQVLSEDQREGLMEELGKAMTKSSMLLAPLAREA